MPNYVTFAPNISYPSRNSDAVGLQLLAHANNTFAVRFSGACARSSRGPRFSELAVSPAEDVPGCAGKVADFGGDLVVPFYLFAMSSDCRAHLNAGHDATCFI